MPILVFELAGARYGLSMSRVQSLSELPTLTAVPGMPDYVAGLGVLRGTLVPFVDLCKFWKMEREGDYRCAVLVRRSGADVALMADKALETRDDTDALQGAGEAAKTGESIARVLCDQTAVLDADKLLDALFGAKQG